MKKIIISVLSALLFVANVSNASESSKEIKLSHIKGDISVKMNPKRIVLLDYGVLDTINTLGIDVEMALPKRTLPKYLSKYKDAKYPDLGSLKEFNLEKVNDFKPDFIVISTRQLSYYEELSKIAPVYLINRLPKNQLSEIKKDIIAISSIFDKKAEGQKAVKDIEDKINSVKEKALKSDKKALFVLTNDGKISAYGAGSRFGIVFDSLALKQVDEHIKASTHGQLVNYEYIALKNPDIIYVVDRSVAIGEPTKSTKLKENALISRTKAAKNNNIIMLDPQAWYLSGGGIETLDIMVSDIAKGLKK